MILLIEIVSLYASFFRGDANAPYWGAILPILYALVIAPHALIGRPDIPRRIMTQTLHAKWNNAEDLVGYICDYWMAFAYPATSWKKRRNSAVLSFVSFFLAAVYVLQEYFVAGIVLLAAGCILHGMSVRVDRPRTVYASAAYREGAADAPARREWELAAMSIIAFTDLYPEDPLIRDSARQVLEDGDIGPLLAMHRYDHGASWV